jgi:hypothetical protein
VVDVHHDGDGGAVDVGVEDAHARPGLKSIEIYAQKAVSGSSRLRENVVILPSIFINVFNLLSPCS